MSNITALSYDSISDKVCWLGTKMHGVALNFVLKLSYKNKDGNRESFMKEYGYESTYLSTNRAYCIKRQYDYYFAIENRQAGIYIQIRPNNMIILLEVLKMVVKELMDGDNWIIKDKRLNCKYHGEQMVVTGLPMQQWLAFYPISMQCYEEGMYNRGVRITLGDDSKFVDMELDDFMGFVYTMNTFNMHLTACEMANYLNWNDYGGSLVTFDSRSSNNDNTPVQNKIPNRGRKKSFFD